MADSPPTGFYEPPECDCDLDVDIVTEVVRDQFPQLAVESVEHLGSGWETDAYLIDDRVVFRFPRYADIARGFDLQDALLTLVASAAGESARIPKLSLWGTPSARFPHRFVGHELIPGVAIDDARAPQALELADDIGRALTRIHAIAAAAADDVDVVPVTVICRDLLDGMLRCAAQVLEMEDLAPDAWAWLHTGVVVPRDYSGALRFIHNDFASEHIIISLTTGRLSGIIDWSGAVLGDPTQDFAYVVIGRGWSFAQRAIAAYSLPVDAAFNERTIFFARIRVIGWLADAIKRRGSTAPALELVRRVFATE